MSAGKEVTPPLGKAPVKMATKKDRTTDRTVKMAEKKERSRDQMAMQFPGLYKEPAVRRTEAGPGMPGKGTLVVTDVKCPPECFCPACTAPGWCAQQSGQWPSPCQVHISEFVVCKDTAVVTEGHAPHHYDCTYWKHFPERTPF